MATEEERFFALFAWVKWMRVATDLQLIVLLFILWRVW